MQALRHGCRGRPASFARMAGEAGYGPVWLKASSSYGHSGFEAHQSPRHGRAGRRWGLVRGPSGENLGGKGGGVPMVRELSSPGRSEEPRPRPARHSHLEGGMSFELTMARAAFELRRSGRLGRRAIRAKLRRWSARPWRGPQMSSKPPWFAELDRPRCPVSSSPSPPPGEGSPAHPTARAEASDPPYGVLCSGLPHRFSMSFEREICEEGNEQRHRLRPSCGWLCMVAPLGVWLRWFLAQFSGRWLGKARLLKWVHFLPMSLQLV
ncbi:hypothetical protein NL676_027713 [Syzygium grande]|nr:hypothetical protein NL676_027713 [Syzygium grande]